MWNLHNKEKRIDQLQSESDGFTVIELIVVIGIFAVMAGLVLFRYKDFGANIELENTAQEVALQIQQAENDAVNGRFPQLSPAQASSNSNTTVLPSNWRPSFGVFFAGHAQYQKEFLYFFDKESVQPGDPATIGINGRGYNNNSWRDFPDSLNSCGTASSECTNVFTLSNGTHIKEVCEASTAVASDCDSNLRTNVSIVFTRPFPDRIAIRDGLGSGNYALNELNGDIRIRIVSDANPALMRDVVVTPLGEIRVEGVQ